jgi:hypothetical protein
MAAQFDIVQDRHVSKKLHILKGPRNAQGGNPVGLETGDVGAFKYNPTFLRLIKAVDTIQQTGFAGAVGSDNRKDFTFFHSGGNTRQGLQPSEAQMDVFDLHLVFWCFTHGLQQMPNPDKPASGL